MPRRGPGRLVCPQCAFDEVDWEFDAEEGHWIYRCRDCIDLGGPLTWVVPDEGRGGGGGSLRDGNGIMARLGLYDGLIEAIGPDTPYFEFGIVEHRFAQVEREAYLELVDRYGHVQRDGQATNTASWMLGRALWALLRQGEVLRVPCAATGCWSYNRQMSAWALPPGPDEPTVLSWAEFAEEEGWSPRSWPALGITAESG
jgi:hypothetical protein